MGTKPHIIHMENMRIVNREIPEWVPQESRVLNVFFRWGPMTISECGDTLGMTAQAAANHISRLCDAGLLQRLGRQRTKRGMHPQVYDVAGRTNGHHSGGADAIRAS
jgi:predicted ArsR family transcriptional regulator